MSDLIDFKALERAPVAPISFDFFAVQNVLAPSSLQAIRDDFSTIEKPGIFPLASLSYGLAFASLIDEVKSSRLTAIIGEKFGIAEPMFTIPRRITCLFTPHPMRSMAA